MNTERFLEAAGTAALKDEKEGVQQSALAMRLMCFSTANGRKWLRCVSEATGGRFIKLGG